MSKFTDRMFGKKIKVTINFIDLDEDNKILASSEELSGKTGEVIEYDTKDIISQLTNQGYELADNEFDGEMKFGEENHVYKVSFHHQLNTVSPDNPGFGYTKDKLQKTVKQVVHYQGAASRTPENSVTEVTFDHLYQVDLITGKVVKDEGWKPEKQSFMIIGTPTLPGFIPDQAAVGGDTVTPEDEDKEYTVKFTINKTPSSLTQTALIRYVDITNDNHGIATDKLTGQPNMPIEYDPKKKIESLESQGFELVHNGFNEAGDIQFFGNADSYEPVFIITMRYTAVAVDSEHPNADVDPSAYEKQSKFTVKFVGAEDDTPEEVNQTVNWSRTVTYIPSTKKLITKGYYDTDWQADKEELEDVEVPSIPGYHADKNLVKALPISEEDQVLTVSYHENGRLIPVDENGTPIQNAPRPQFESDPNDASRVLDDQIIPEVEGFRCDLMTITPTDPGKDLNVAYKANKKNDTLYINLGQENNAPVEPEDAANAVEETEVETQPTQTTEPAVEPEQNTKPITDQDTENTAPVEPQITVPEPEETSEEAENVETTQPAQAQEDQGSDQKAVDKSKLKDQVAIVNFIDVDHNGASLTSSGPLVGKPGDSISDLYSTEIPLKVIKKAGYHVVFNNFDSDGFVQRFDNNDLMTQVFTIGVSKKLNTQTITDLIVSHSNGKDSDEKVKALEETKNQLEKIRPTLVPSGNGDDSQTVTRLLDIVTALLNLIFVLGNGNENKDN